MLALYLTCLLIGGVLVGMSALVGGGDHELDLDADVDMDLDLDVDADVDADLDGDLDVDADVDGDVDADADGDADVGGGGFDAWLPIASLRFWTFFLAFGGLTGALLTFFDRLAPLWVGVSSGAVGYVCGLSITRLVRALRKQRVDSTIADTDFLGNSAKVLLPVGQGQTGKVRIEIGGRLVDVTAETEDEQPLEIARQVLVYDMRDDGTLLVTGRAALD